MSIVGRGVGVQIPYSRREDSCERPICKGFALAHSVYSVAATLGFRSERSSSLDSGIDCPAIGSGNVTLKRAQYSTGVRDLHGCWATCQR
jgi:hypothetical protein